MGKRHGSEGLRARSELGQAITISICIPAHPNDETLLVIESPQLSAQFTCEMDRMWRGAELGITPHIQRKLDRQQIRCCDGKAQQT
tara:strand:- start:161 stop:418 length:258 start_codon:yes stop_codon:yes gene_type:complete